MRRAAAVAAVSSGRFFRARCSASGPPLGRQLATNSEATSLAAVLPERLSTPCDGLAAVQRLCALAHTCEAAEELCLDIRVQRFLADFGTQCEGLNPQQLRETIGVFARAQHMPPALWQGGLAAEVPRAVEELPPLHAVHAALMMAALDLRSPADVLREVAEQLEQRVSDLNAIGLTGALVALSQLGPWPEPVPGDAVVQALAEFLEHLGPKELSACALAAATLGVDELAFWQNLHAALLGCVEQLMPRHVADTLLALATTQLCPIALLEALQTQLTNVARLMEFDEALTCAWAMSALRLFPSPAWARLIRCLSNLEPAMLSEMQGNQVRQVLLSLELEPSAKEALAMVPASLVAAIDRGNPIGEQLCRDDETLEGFCEMLSEVGVEFQLGEEVRSGLYTIDVAFRTTEGTSPRAVVFGIQDKADAFEPHDPWSQLKCRHLQLLGWSVTWLPVQRWHIWSEEERRDWVRQQLPTH